MKKKLMSAKQELEEEENRDEEEEKEDEEVVECPDTRVVDHVAAWRPRVEVHLKWKRKEH